MCLEWTMDKLESSILGYDNETRMETITLTHSSHDPFMYVLLFPRGRDGWYLNMQRDDRKKLTPLLLYSWHFFRYQMYSTLSFMERIHFSSIEWIGSAKWSRSVGIDFGRSKKRLVLRTKLR